MENAARESERLLCLLLDIPRVSLILDPDRRLDAGSCLRLDALLDRRICGEPLQHIEGTVEFREIVIGSDRRALIPRPETEQLVELITRWARERPGAGKASRDRAAAAPPIGTVLDVGTGSGVIALSLLSEGTAARAIGIDISRDALALAWDNRRLAGMEGRLELLACDVDPLRSFAARPAFDVIVSNPPYVRTAELDRLPTEVRDHDPHAALDGGTDGLAVIRRIAAGARERLFSGGGLFLEIGAEQAESVVSILERSGPWRSVSVRRDLAGRDRFVAAEC
ncbi:MAG: peptide chain release factor N(5)-glutamine methyltransferase [marine benthic group bacterium]|nr:peptide chain release factor N(5)-glutamine methyltransferase [Gemmatimonadota bacterium]